MSTNLAFKRRLHQRRVVEKIRWKIFSNLRESKILRLTTSNNRCSIIDNYKYTNKREDSFPSFCSFVPHILRQSWILQSFQHEYRRLFMPELHSSCIFRQDIIIYIAFLCSAINLGGASLRKKENCSPIDITFHLYFTIIRSTRRKDRSIRWKIIPRDIICL